MPSWLLKLLPKNIQFVFVLVGLLSKDGRHEAAVKAMTDKGCDPARAGKDVAAIDDVLKFIKSTRAK